MSEKWTPGEWLVAWGQSDRTYPLHIGVATDDRNIVTAFGKPAGEESIANAKLISAAPELYSALKAIVDQWDTPNWKLTEHTGVLIANGRAALRKARGE